MMNGGTTWEQTITLQRRCWSRLSPIRIYKHLKNGELGFPGQSDHSSCGWKPNPEFISGALFTPLLLKEAMFFFNGQSTWLEPFLYAIGDSCSSEDEIKVVAERASMMRFPWSLKKRQWIAGLKWFDPTLSVDRRLKLTEDSLSSLAIWREGCVPLFPRGADFPFGEGAEQGRNSGSQKLLRPGPACQSQGQQRRSSI